MTRLRHFCTTMLSSLEGLKLKVTRCKPKLVGPAKSTPREVKSLSNIDNQESTRCLAPIINFYRNNPSMQGKDPAKVVRDALARALVSYYPLAGRLIEGHDRRLSVDCAGEGVLFVEADADVELVQLGDPPRPPFPWVEQFFPNVPPSGGIINSPLMYFQVTRLRCGGFVLAYRFNHVMNDAPAMAQFLIDAGEMSRGALAPSITPIWRRELFSSTAPLPSGRSVISTDHPDGRGFVIERSFLFGPSELLAIRSLVPDQLRPNTSTFEILMAYLWRCLVVAQDLDPNDVVRLKFPVTVRNRMNNVVPVGYYGNAYVTPMAETSARQLCEGPMEHTIGLVKKVKEMGKEEYMSWRVNPPVIPCSSWNKCFAVSDIRRVGFGDADFGWGKAAFGSLAKLEFDPAAVLAPFKNHNGEDGILVSVCLRSKIMGRFETEVNNMISHGLTYSNRSIITPSL